MTVAPSDLLSLRQSLFHLTGVTDPVEIGIVGNDRHGTGYHLGVGSIKSRGNYPNGDYSTRQLRDRVSGDTASAMDVTLSWPIGGRNRAIKWSNNIATFLRLGMLPDIRAMNYLTLQGEKVRYDSFTRTQVSTSDTVDIHTHIEWWRDTEGHRNFSLLLEAEDMAFTDQETKNIAYMLGADADPGGPPPVHVQFAQLNNKLDQVTAKVDALQSSGVPVTIDLDAIAAKVADLLATRLQS